MGADVCLDVTIRHRLADVLEDAVRARGRLFPTDAGELGLAHRRDRVGIVSHGVRQRFRRPLCHCVRVVGPGEHLLLASRDGLDDPLLAQLAR